MDFQNLNTIIDTMLSWFFDSELLATATFSFFVDLTKFVLGFMGAYYIGIYPFVVAFRSIIKDFRVKK